MSMSHCPSLTNNDRIDLLCSRDQASTCSHKTRFAKLVPGTAVKDATVAFAGPKEEASTDTKSTNGTEKGMMRNLASFDEARKDR